MVHDSQYLLYYCAQGKFGKTLLTQLSVLKISYFMTNSSKTLHKSARSNLSFPRGHFFPKNANFRYQKYWSFSRFLLFTTFVSSTYEISPQKIFENSKNYRFTALRVGPFFCLIFDAIFIPEKIIRLQYHLCQNNSELL